MKNELIELLQEWVRLNSEECNYDYHGNCQAHFGQVSCIVERTEEIIENIKGGSADSPIDMVDVVTFCNLLVDAGKSLNFLKKAMAET